MSLPALHFSLLAILGGLVLGCQPPPDTEIGGTPDLQGIVTAVVESNDAVHGAALCVHAPGRGLSWHGAAGLADPDHGTPMTAAVPVRIASNTKTYLAAAVLRAWEEGGLELDDPIADHLAPEHVEILRSDGYHPEQIAIRHLLTHTSGLFDHSESPKYTEAITSEPNHRWTRTEQVTAAAEWGDPHTGPGEIYTYCDTGYVLLGEILERATGKPLAASVRELLGFERLGLASTWWESLEPAPPGVLERAHQYLGELDTFSFDPSFDLYGGGGLAASVIDLAHFYHALFTGDVFQQPGTAETMLTSIEGISARADAGSSALPPGSYRMGIWVVEVAGLTTYRHTGFWGTLATHIPELDLTIACTVNQNQGRQALLDLADQTIEAVTHSSDS